MAKRSKPKILARRKRAQDRKCPFCESQVKPSYKEVENLVQVLSPRGKILPRKKTGVCAGHQRAVGRAVKRARVMAML